jgi:hypothetical protein
VRIVLATWLYDRVVSIVSAGIHWSSGVAHLDEANQRFFCCLLEICLVDSLSVKIPKQQRCKVYPNSSDEASLKVREENSPRSRQNLVERDVILDED